MINQKKPRVLLASIVPPHNDGGSRILMYRHLVERLPFELHVASNADFADNLLIHTKLKLPWIVEKIRKSRFGPRFKRRILDFQNFVWPFLGCSALDKAIKDFRPDVILTLAEPSISYMALKAAKNQNIPFAAFFMDWFPIMEGHFGLRCMRSVLSRRFQRIYKECDLAFCVSEGMKERLGSHRNSHTLYPISGIKSVQDQKQKPRTGKFQVVYVGTAQGLYGRMLQSLIGEIVKNKNFQLTIVGPNSDWPCEIKAKAEQDGICLGFRPPKEAEKYLQKADVLLMVMSFEKEYELFTKTSFNTKYSDYAAFGKPIIFWAPSYAAPCELAQTYDASVVVSSPDPAKLFSAIKKIANNKKEIQRLSSGSQALHKTTLNPDLIQKKFVKEISNLISKKKEKTSSKKK